MVFLERTSPSCVQKPRSKMSGPKKSAENGKFEFPRMRAHAASEPLTIASSTRISQFPETKVFVDKIGTISERLSNGPGAQRALDSWTLFLVALHDSLPPSLRHVVFTSAERGGEARRRRGEMATTTAASATTRRVVHLQGPTCIIEFGLMVEPPIY